MATIIPFGKYKGREVSEIMETDPGYVEWLTLQSWFVEKFRSIYDEIARGGTTEATPEHNALQARFLDDKFCEKLATIIGIEANDNGRKIRSRKMENVFDVSLVYQSNDVAFVEAKPIIGDDYPIILRQIRAQQMRLYAVDFKRHYPNINIPPPPSEEWLSNRNFILFYERFSAFGATLEQVRTIFAESANVRLVSLAEVLAVEVPIG